MPDGTVVSDVPEGTTREQLMQKLQKRTETAATAPAGSKFESSPAGALTAGVGGALDFARAGVTGAGATVAGGLMGGATLATNAMGLTDTDPVSMIRHWQSMAYQPETPVGKKIAGAVGGAADATVGALGRWLGGRTFEQTGSPMEATVAELMPDMISTITGAEAPAMVKQAAMQGAIKLAQKAVFNKTKNEAFRTAQRANFKVSPTEYGGVIGRTVAGIGGKAEVERMISVGNEQRIVDLAKLDMGIPEGAPLDRASFAAAKFREGQVYQQARALGRITVDQGFTADLTKAGAKFEQVAQDFPETDLARLADDINKEKGRFLVESWDAGSAIDQMSFLREQASDLLRSDSAVERKLGFVKRDIAAAFEDRLWRHAKDTGQPQLAAQFQEARKKLAKIHVYEDSTNLDTGRISARSIVAQREARGGTVDPFSDELKLIADSAGAFPKSFQQMDTKGRYGPISVFEWMALAGGATSAMVGHSMVGLGVMGAAGAREGARALSAHQPFGMRPESGEPGLANQLAQGLGSPAGQATGALTGAESGQ